MLRKATIRFEGKAFQALTWNRLLRDMGFQVFGGALWHATYAAGSNHLLLKGHGFTVREGRQGYEWQITLNQTGLWEGTVKFYNVLLAAFIVPQNVKVTLEDGDFEDPRSLGKHAEAAIVRDFGTVEPIKDKISRPNCEMWFN